MRKFYRRIAIGKIVDLSHRDPLGERYDASRDTPCPDRLLLAGFFFLGGTSNL